MTAPRRATRSLRPQMLWMTAVALLFFGAIAIVFLVEFRPRVRVLADEGIEARRAFGSRTEMWETLKRDQAGLLSFYFRSRSETAHPDSITRWRERLTSRAQSVEFLEPITRSFALDSTAVRLIGRADITSARMLSRMLAVVAAMEIRDQPLADAMIRAADAELVPMGAVQDSITLATLEHLRKRSSLLDESVVSATRQLALWGLLGVVLVLWAALWMRKRLLQPLAQLDAGLARMESGDLDVTLPVKRDDELGRVAQQLNQTTRALRERREDEARQAADRTAQRTRAIFDSSLDPVLVFDADGHIREWNPQAEVVFNWTRDEVIGQPYAELLQPLDASAAFPVRLETLLDRGGRTELQCSRRDGTRLPVEVSVVPLSGTEAGERAAFLHDVSEQRALELSLRQAQKLEAIGQLAGGVAHDFNNLLTGIIGYAELMAHHESAADILRDDAKAIRVVALRGADLTRSLLTFARRTPHRDEPFDLVDVLRETVTLVQRTFDRRIVVQFHEEVSFAPMRGDASLLSNALLNLAVNARDVMPSGGNLTFTIRNAMPTNREKDRCVELLVIDSGPGMSPEVQRRLFEPFFTTKDLGKGTGLGLPLVYGAITAHHGTIEVSSEVGAGSTFVLCLPLSPDAVSQSSRRSFVPERKQGRVLIVDDEQLVRTVGARMLRRLGYEVDEAPHGEAAIAALQTEVAQFDLVMIDGNMPRLSGVETAALIHARHPRLPIMLVTGQPGHDAAETLRARGILEVLEKPYSLEQLSAAMSRWIRVNHSH